VPADNQVSDPIWSYIVSETRKVIAKHLKMKFIPIKIKKTKPSRSVTKFARMKGRKAS
jgi:hypothetical protein